MYMTGQISPYYLKGSPGNIFSHFLKSLGTAALSGEAIQAITAKGAITLQKTKKKLHITANARTDFSPRHLRL